MNCDVRYSIKMNKDTGLVSTSHLVHIGLQDIGWNEKQTAATYYLKHTGNETCGALDLRHLTTKLEKYIELSLWDLQFVQSVCS